MVFVVISKLCRRLYEFSKGFDTQSFRRRHLRRIAHTRLKCLRNYRNYISHNWFLLEWAKWPRTFFVGWISLVLFASSLISPVAESSLQFPQYWVTQRFPSDRSVPLWDGMRNRKSFEECHLLLDGTLFRWCFRVCLLPHISEETEVSYEGMHSLVYTCCRKAQSIQHYRHRHRY